MNFLAWLLGWLRGGPTPPPAPPSPPVPPPLPPQPPDVAKIEASIFTLVNLERTKRGKVSLRQVAALTDAAIDHADLMAARGIESHQLPGEAPLPDRLSMAGYRWAAYAENVAEGYPTAEAVVAAWVASPGHFADMMGPYADTGVGVALDSRGRPWFCQVFGDPA